MKLSWSIISIISRFTAVGVGIVQSLIILKILPVGEYGLIGLVASIGAIVGVYQNLGISSASTREIAAAGGRKEAFKVFIGSLLVRYGISLPLVIGLFVAAPYIAQSSQGRTEIILPLRIFAVVLFIQALQSVLNSVIQGLRKFKFLFIFQAAIAFVSIAIYIPVVLKFGFLGYFYSLFLFNLVSTFVLTFYAIRLFKGKVELPTKRELVSIIKAVFSIGIFVYVIKILFTQWERLGPIVLGETLSDEALGLFTFALFVSSKVMTISDAITDVTLPSMTDAFEKSRTRFAEIFLRGNSKSFMLITFAAVSLILFKEDLFRLVDLVFSFMGRTPISVKYESAFRLMNPLIISFWAYSHMNLLKSGLAVPAKKLWGTVFAYAIMLVLTLWLFNTMNFEPALRFSWAMAAGALAAYTFMLVSLKANLKFFALTSMDAIFLLVSTIVLFLYKVNLPVYLIYIVYVGFTYYIYPKK